MHGELVALDLETTGLDPSRDFIIEIGAVRLKEGVIIDEYSTLINPGITIPANVTHITGISNTDVGGKPRVETVLPEFAAFVGNAPVIAHNVSFDMAVLQRYSILKDNLRLDTYDLAAIVLPNAARYNLGTLTSTMGVTLERAHRALDDARAAGLLYWELWRKILTLPLETLQEVVDAAADLGWESAPVFAAALREQAGTQPLPARQTATVFPPFIEPPALQSSGKIQPLDIVETVDLLQPDGPLAAHIPGYEQRDQQVQMAAAIVNAFNVSQHMLIEAGTGTGKSLAYLLPAVLWAVKNNERVVISTNTIALQDQLIGNDIPLLRRALGIDFRAAVLKGRGNYLCPRRLNIVRRRRPTNLDELRTLSKTLVWLLEDQSGDKGALNLRGPAEHNAWRRLSAEDEECTFEQCHAQMQGTCPFYKARKNAEAAHLLIVNHALLIADAVREQRVLPEYRYLIVDEAHQLEDAITSGLIFRTDEAALLRRLSDLGSARRGLLGDLLNSVGDHVPEKESVRLQNFVQQIGSAVNAMQVHVTELFKALSQLLTETSSGRGGEGASTLRVNRQQRTRPGFTTVQSAWNTLNEFFEVISHAMQRLTQALHHVAAYNVPRLDDLMSSAATLAAFLRDTRQRLHQFLLEPDENTIYWISAGQHGEKPALHTAPLHVGPLMEQHLWHRKESVILTSATLRTDQDFRYLKDRLYADDVAALELGSPFDYRSSTMIYIPDDMPEPTDRDDYQLFVERGIIELATALDGRVLALFTSYAQLRQTAQAITPRLALGDIIVYDQSDGSSRQTLLEGFKSAQKAVLLGTKTFWEGIDIPGDALSALVIVRLPFAVPTDPVFAARSETYNDSFNDYSVPDAVLRFRQGFGRLIRTQTDRGVVTIFDRRIMTKSYGTNFLQALPDCTVRYGGLQGLAQAALDWLNPAETGS